jgi:hypothetical protein
MLLFNLTRDRVGVSEDEVDFVSRATLRKAGTISIQYLHSSNSRSSLTNLIWPEHDCVSAKKIK